ncbi:hypothetical protein RCL_jg27497.t1 [Rhizophagus clarus]|uniref:Uncharacterized protein n=1 Tax=Rhizophagus clarus TaxID=94130 RepID=A0A8H3LVZ4_9GLOM|nr:hypothetical protein RCL_jg27497.t1 [Rhizophagus clarus]
MPAMGPGFLVLGFQQNVLQDYSKRNVGRQVICEYRRFLFGLFGSYSLDAFGGVDIAKKYHLIDETVFVTGRLLVK